MGYFPSPTGYKQRGQAAVDAMNVFIHLTYDDEVVAFYHCWLSQFDIFRFDFSRST